MVHPSGPCREALIPALLELTRLAPSSSASLRSCRRRAMSSSLKCPVCLKDQGFKQWSPAQWKKWNPWEADRNCCADCEQQPKTWTTTEPAQMTQEAHKAYVEELMAGWGAPQQSSKKARRASGEEAAGPATRSRSPDEAQHPSGAASSWDSGIMVSIPDVTGRRLEARCVAWQRDCPPPVDAPRPPRQFEIIAHAKVETFRETMFNKQQNRKVAERPNEVWRPPPMYLIDWANPQHDATAGSVSFPVRRRDGDEYRYQNGSLPLRPGHPDFELEMTHATRPDFLASIMLEGVRTTGLSHRVVGLWCRRMDWADGDSHEWGRTPLDFFSGCFLTLTASTERLKTSVKQIGGNGERIVVVGPAHSSDIPVRISRVTLRIPSLQLQLWRDSLRICLAECIVEHGRHLARGHIKNAKKELWMLVAHRLCYDRRHAWETGKYKFVNSIAHLMHIEIFEALRPLYFLKNEAEKRKGWRARTWQHLPEPFQKWFWANHEAAVPHFQQDTRFDTHGLYRVTGLQPQAPPLEEWEEPGPGRLYAVVSLEEQQQVEEGPLPAGFPPSLMPPGID